MAETSSKFYYIYSCDFHHNLEIKIGQLEGQRERPSYSDLVKDPLLKHSGAYQGLSELYVTCQVFSDGVLLAEQASTSYKAFKTRWEWNEWLRLPVEYSDLPRNSLLALTVWDIYGTNKSMPVGGTVIPLFSKMGTLRRGMYDLKVWPGEVADGQRDTSTPGKPDSSMDELSRLAKLSRKHRENHMMKIDWLDRLTFGKIQEISQQLKRESNFMYLTIEFPRVHFDNQEYQVIYFEEDAEKPMMHSTNAELVTVPDPEMSLENLLESKHHKLSRSLRAELVDRDMKPDAKTRNDLANIVSYPPTKVLTSEEQDLVWKFRFYLSSQKKALTKFLKCVNWDIPGEAKQALELLNQWSPMEVEDSLELLSPVFMQPTVRKYAVKRLRQADDEELLLYLLQLVQALKYENFEEIEKGTDMPVRESVSPEPSAVPGGERERTLSTLSRTSSDDSIQDVLGTSPGRDDRMEQTLENEMDLATFLIYRACRNSTVANYFYWYLSVECEDTDVAVKGSRAVYQTVIKRLSHALSKGSNECKMRRAILIRQQGFVGALVQLFKMVARESGDRQKKEEKLKEFLREPETCGAKFPNFEPLPLPLNPEIRVMGIKADNAELLKSAMMPIKVSFITVHGTENIVLFKHGDDLRQDQLILQIISLMDKLLLREKLDLKLTPYKVLATGNRHGFVEFIQSMSVAKVLQGYKDIQRYFKSVAPMANAPYGISPEVMDNYVKSCAGYCVVTYLLGVGDRHLDNLLLTPTGKLFHIDFGYILGRDPKPMPPPMKLSKEMVEGMGGSNAEHFQDFKKHCYTAFLALRRHSNLILNLFSLMVDSTIPDIALEPDKAVKKVHEKFVLHYSEEEAVHHIQNLIDTSVTAVMPVLLEQMHKVAQYWRR